jgi:hypothetical protein
VEAQVEKVVYDRVDRLAGSLGIPIAEVVRRALVPGLDYIERDVRVERDLGAR